MSDVIIYVGGISPQLEGEEMKVAYEGFSGGDRTEIGLPAVQSELLKALQATGKPVVFVSCSGSAIAMPWEATNLPAILQAWYPGEQADAPWPTCCLATSIPPGVCPLRLPVHRRPAGVSQLLDVQPHLPLLQWPADFAFGHGSSYTKFHYNTPTLNGTNFAAGTRSNSRLPCSTPARGTAMRWRVISGT